MISVTFTDTMSGSEIYKITIQTENKADAIDRAYKVAGQLGYRMDRWVRATAA